MRKQKSVGPQQILSRSFSHIQKREHIRHFAVEECLINVGPGGRKSRRSLQLGNFRGQDNIVGTYN